MADYKQIAKIIGEADAILIGASNGLSISEGLNLFADDEAFEELFGDLKRKYGIRCLLHGMSARWPSEEQKWGFWSRLIKHYCLDYKPTPVMQYLRHIVGDKDYFILTSNGECHFELCGFDTQKIYEIEGNWLTMQCQNVCHDGIYPNIEQVKLIAEAERNGMVPAGLVPRCPKCGAAMSVHMVGENFIEDEGAQRRFEQFLNKYHGKKLVILELGIGWRNQLIKAPLMRLTASEPNSTYITINLGEVFIAENIRNKSFGIDGSLTEVLQSLAKEIR